MKLPIKVDDQLTLRWATPEDREKVAAFNAEHHGENDEEREALKVWTKDLFRSNHPTTSASDFTIVETAAGEIVSCTCLISQVWRYGDVTLTVGQPELVATAQKYRRRGLVRHQMEAIHALSAEKGELLTGITGIPWYYRQFGYSMALDLGGLRIHRWPYTSLHPPATPTEDKPEKNDLLSRFSRRDATLADIPLLEKLYEQHTQRYLIKNERDRAEWEYILGGHSDKSIRKRQQSIFIDQNGIAAGYIRFSIWENRYFIQEVGLLPGRSWRQFGLYLIEETKRHAQKLNGEKRQPPVDHLSFNLGQDHPIYDALDPELQEKSKSYAWYIRIPDIRKFLNHIKPVLESRIANSVLAGYTGTHQVNLYRDHFSFRFEKGALVEIEEYEKKVPAHGDTRCTEPQFIQLICGHRTLDELQHIHVDCFTNAEGTILMRTLFPKMASQALEYG